MFTYLLIFFFRGALRPQKQCGLSGTGGERNGEWEPRTTSVFTQLQSSDIHPSSTFVVLYVHRNSMAHDGRGGGGGGGAQAHLPVHTAPVLGPTRYGTCSLTDCVLSLAFRPHGLPPLPCCCWRCCCACVTWRPFHPGWSATPAACARRACEAASAAGTLTEASCTTWLPAAGSAASPTPTWSTTGPATAPRNTSGWAGSSASADCDGAGRRATRASSVGAFRV